MVLSGFQQMGGEGVQQKPSSARLSRLIDHEFCFCRLDLSTLLAPESTSLTFSGANELANNLLFLKPQPAVAADRSVPVREVTMMQLLCDSSCPLQMFRNY
jgi:hypothetical protein